MLPFILLSFLIAKVKGMRLRPLLHDWSVAPFFLVEAVYWVFQVFTFCGDYRFVPYASYLQAAYLLSMLPPVLYHQLYKRAITGAALVGVGTVLNRVVMRANNGQMPVYPTLSRLTGYCRPETFSAANDPMHVLMSSMTKLNFLADYIDLGFSIMSLGDVLIHLFPALVLYGVLTKLNKRGAAA